MLKKAQERNRGKSQFDKVPVKMSSCAAKRGETSVRTLGKRRKGYGGMDSTATLESGANVHFSDVGSKHSALNRNRQRQEESMASNAVPDHVKKRKEFLNEDEVTRLGSLRSGVSSSFRASEKNSKARDFAERSSENFTLKKTEEITNFNVGICHEVNGFKVDSVLESNYSELDDGFGRSGLAKKEPKMSVVNERHGPVSTQARFGPSKKESRTGAAFDNWEPPMSRFGRPGRSYEEEKVYWSWLSKKPSFGKSGFINFFRKRSSKIFKKNIFKRRSTAKSDSGENLEIEVNRKEDLKIKEYIKEFYFYVIFLILVTFTGTSTVSSDMFYFTDETASLFFDTPNFPYTNVSEEDFIDLLRAEKNGWLGYAKKSLRNSNTFADFWAFAESTMIDLFYWDFYYSRIDPVAPTEEDDKKLFYSNQLLGVPRIRQIRVRNDSCKIHQDVQRFFKSCYYYYSVFSEETRPIREDMKDSITASAWVYTEASELDSSFYWGEISIYGGGGYYIDLSSYRNESMQMVRELKQNLWLSRATRVIFIDFNLYNANVNLFCVCKIVLEFPPVGGMIPKVDFNTLKLIQYLSIMDFFVLGCQFVFIVYTIYYTYISILTFKEQKGAFFFSWWNFVDVFMNATSYGYIALSFVLYVYTDKLVIQLSDHSEEYVDFTFIKTLKVNSHNLLALVVFSTWVKLYRFLKFNVVMVEFRRTLSRSVKDILGFFPMFLILFIAFALLAYLIFGTQVKHYNTVWFSFLSLLEAFLGGFQYREIQESNHILGPIFYVGFIFFIFFVLLNVFVAIINDAYSAVKSEIISDIPRTGEYFKRGFLNLLGYCCCNLDKKFEKKESIKKEMVKRKIMRTLRHAGFSEIEIKIFFSKYNINMNNILDAETQRKIIEDLELKRIDFSENAEQFQIQTLRRRINSLNERLEQMEGNLQPVIDKVDVLIKRL